MAKIFKDIALDENNDLIIRNGDLVVADSLDQEVGLILQSNQGQWRQHPLLGPSLTSLIKSNDISKLKRRIKIHLGHDNKTAEKVDFNEGEIYLKVKNK